MFEKSRCDGCGKCMAKCHYIDFNEETGGRAILELAENGYSPWIDSCITCFACSENCPSGANPFDLICECMEKSGKYVDPALVEMMHGHFSPKGGFTAPESGKKAISLCTIYSVLPEDTFTGPLFEGLSLLKGRFFFCHVLYPHLGNMSLFSQEMPGVIKRLSETGAEEIVFVHDDCYSMIALAKNQGLEIPFKATHIIEYMVEYLKSNKDRVQPLNMKIAYQRPCASRLTPEKDIYLDELFNLIGVERVEREYDRQNALCCGENSGGAIPARNGQERFQKMNIDDAQAFQADAMVFLCPMCMGALGKKAEAAGMKSLFIVEPVKMALGK